MKWLRHFLRRLLPACAGCTGAVAASAPTVSVPPPIVRPGFYRVGGDPACQAEFGPVAFVAHRPRALVLAGGRLRPVSLRRENETRYAITGSACWLSFENNDLRTVGICTRLLAHRGDTRTFPANTLPAFQDAVLQGFAGFELDVRLSADNVAIVSHDDKLTAATDCRGRISLIEARSIRQCRAIRSPLIPESRLLARPARFAAGVPTLRETLERFLADPRVGHIVIDIKPFPARERLVEALVAAVPGCPGRGCPDIQRRLSFISQDAGEIARLHSAFPDSHIALESNQTVSGLIDDPEGDHWANSDFDTFSLSFNSLFDPRLWLVKLVRGENLTPRRRFERFYQRNRNEARRRRLLGWTVNNSAGVSGLRRYAFADILTDLAYQDFVRRLLVGVSSEALAENIGRLASGTGIGCELEAEPESAG